MQLLRSPRRASPISLAGGLVADHHRAEQIFPGGAGAFGDGEAGRRERRAVAVLADVAVIRCRGVAQTGVDACGAGRRKPGRIETATVASRRPPRSSRYHEGCRPDSISDPAALDNVLARIIFACSMARPGRSS